jgi:hypothetical protein
MADRNLAENAPIVATERLIKVICGNPCKRCVIEEQEEVKQALSSLRWP